MALARAQPADSGRRSRIPIKETAMIPHRKGVFARVAPIALTTLLACSDAGSDAVTAPITPALASVNNLRASTFTTNEIFPFGFEATECGNETVVVSGNLHVVTHGTVTGSGHLQAVLHVNPQNIRGFGVTTGTEYLAPGMLQVVSNVNGGAPLTETFVNNFELIGLGAAPNLTLHQTVRVTINANGEITAAFDHLTTTCK
jgi:hypothetical protein